MGIYCSLVVRRAVEESCGLLRVVGRQVSGKASSVPPTLPDHSAEEFLLLLQPCILGHLKAARCLLGGQLLLGLPLVYAKAMQHLPLPKLPLCPISILAQGAGCVLQHRPVLPVSPFAPQRSCTLWGSAAWRRKLSRVGTDSSFFYKTHSVLMF